VVFFGCHVTFAGHPVVVNMSLKLYARIGDLYVDGELELKGGKQM